MAPPANFIISTSTTSDRTDGAAKPSDSYAAASIGDFRRILARGNPPRRGNRYLRHPWLRGEAPTAAFRRSAFFGSLGQSLSIGRLSREMRHRRNDRSTVREQADHTKDPHYDRGHELRFPFGASQGSARSRRDGDGHLDNDRRRRHDA